jgi:poly(A) polymerase
MIKKIKSLFSGFQKDNIIRLSVKNLDDLKYFNTAKQIFICFQNQNYKLKLVGGCVRKLITEEKIDDMDIAINIEPEKIKKVLVEQKIKFVETGITHGTITVLINDFKFEITSLRKDLSTDGRHAKVEFTSNWEQDAQRRDFTINAIYSDISGEVYDPLNGIEDLKNGIIKFIGDPNQRIQEDYLRILRYLRFYTQYNKNKFHDEIAIKAIKRNLDGLAKISRERILGELFKMMKLNNFSKLFEDEFCRFIILSILPQLRNYNRIKILNKISYKIKKQIDKILLLSILIVDETDNCNFFLYKYQLSNEDKKRILFIKNSFKNYSKQYLYSKKNLLKLTYLSDKSSVIELLIFLIFVNPEKISNIENLIDYIKEKTIPEFPINAKFLKEEFNFLEGKQLGDALKKLEKQWIDDGFKIDKGNVKSLLNLKKI